MDHTNSQDAPTVPPLRQLSAPMQARPWPGILLGRQRSTPDDFAPAAPAPTSLLPPLKASPAPPTPKAPPVRPTVPDMPAMGQDRFGYHPVFDDYFKKLVMFQQRCGQNMEDYECKSFEPENYYYEPLSKQPVRTLVTPVSPGGLGVVYICHPSHKPGMLDAVLYYVVRAIRMPDMQHLILVCLPRTHQGATVTTMFTPQFAPLIMVKAYKGVFTGKCVQCRKLAAQSRLELMKI